MRIGPFYVQRARWAKAALWGHTRTHCLDLPLRQPQLWTVTITTADETHVFQGATPVAAERLLGVEELADRHRNAERAREIAQLVGRRSAV
jgi:hypothetical protein